MKRVILVAAALLLVAASNGYVLFQGQVNGPVKNPGGIDVETFRLHKNSGLFYTETYYHHLNFQDGAMITVSVGFNKTEATIAFVYDRPKMNSFNDYLILDIDEAKFDQKGFGMTVGQSRFWLDGEKYFMDINLPRTKCKIAYDIIGPSYTYGDGFVRYPDGDTYMWYTLPISWARAKVDATFDGKPVKLEGFGNMNHDAGEIFPAYVPSNWQAFWFFAPDHTLQVTDHFTHEKFGRELIQRLVFLEKDGHMFTSTSYKLAWDCWADVQGIPFRYPKHYTLVAEGGGAKIIMEVNMDEVILMEDLYSNLPDILKPVITRLTPNGWTVDSWSKYNLTYTVDGNEYKYQGRGVARWTNLEGVSK